MTPKLEAAKLIGKLLDRQEITPVVSQQLSTLQKLIEFRVRSAGTPLTTDKATHLMSIVRSDIDETYERIHILSVTGLAMLIGTAKHPMEPWWKAQAQTLSERFEREIRLSMLANETMEQLLGRLQHGGDHQTSPSAG